jgi:hypothetical protein
VYLVHHARPFLRFLPLSYRRKVPPPDASPG